MVSYMTMREMEKNNGRLNWALFYLHRYIRVTAVYAVTILFRASVYKYVLQEQRYKYEEEVDNCRESWWRNLLYIRNIQPGGDSESIPVVSVYDLLICGYDRNDLRNLYNK